MTGEVRVQNDTSDMFVIVGQLRLDDDVGALGSLRGEDCTVKLVALCPSNVLHSVAVSHLMATLDNGVLMASLGVDVGGDCNINVIRCGGGFKGWSVSAYETVYADRSHNFKRVLRSGGVDAGAILEKSGRRTRQVLDSRWKTFCGV